MTYLKEISEVRFPDARGISINMMPIIQGDVYSLPEEIRPYQELIDLCSFKKGSTTYLTINESIVPAGQTQRRGGIHTEGFGESGGRFGGGGDRFGGGSRIGWGGWGKMSGLFMASSDGACRAWDCQVLNSDTHGGIEEPKSITPQKMKPNVLYWMTDRTPHEALPSSGYRQFFRLVSEEVDLWFERHNTPNPLGVLPNCQIATWDKFE